MRAPRLELLLVAALGLFACFGAVSATTALVSDKGSTRALQELTSIAKAEVGSRTFALVDSYDCDNGMVATVRKFFKANDATFDTCISESNYQMYPYTGVVPDAKSVVGLVNSAACMGIITSVVLLNMPPCVLDDLPMRAACEVLLYYSLALRSDVDPPTAEQFFELMSWRRDVNLAKAANKPFDAKSQTFAVFTKTVRKVLTSSKVTIMDNFTVILDDEEADSIEMNDGAQPSFVSTNSSMDYFVGKVVASADALDDPPATESVVTQSSGATTLATTSTLVVLLLLAAAIV
ncbi:hypothetical protein PRIC1_014345 [Phytophthora ramorum]|uniref:uncharacterized protein n=1 Tax=Phytophthora ramorum TaxID=164328 RepID=UPI0030B57079|nr:hypothetical protein KRP23_8167 [Phytophthora ramorum]KAH7497666.1 hypothetical protein KRP22_12728 [Phytophthora ramorum]